MIIWNKVGLIDCHFEGHHHRKAAHFLQDWVWRRWCHCLIMFIKNKQNRYYELFQPVKTYKGEPPTLAGKDLLTSVLWQSICSVFPRVLFSPLQDFSFTQTLPLRWRLRHIKLSPLDPFHNKMEAKVSSLIRAKNKPVSQSKCCCWVFLHGVVTYELCLVDQCNW